jgi:hypothetical protein
METTQFETTYDVTAIDSTHVFLDGNGIRKAPYHVQQLSHFDDFEKIKAFARSESDKNANNENAYSRDLALRVRDGQVGSGMTHR